MVNDYGKQEKKKEEFAPVSITFLEKAWRPAIIDWQQPFGPSEIKDFAF